MAAVEVKPPKVTPVEVEQVTTEADEAMDKKLREHFGDRLKLVSPDTVIRFTRGFAHEADREAVTIEKLGHLLDLAEKFDMPNILDDEWDEEEECMAAWPCYLYGQDNQGHVVMYDEIGAVDSELVKKTFNKNMEKLQRFRFRFYKRVFNRKQEVCDETGMMIYKHIIVMDVSNFGMAAIAGELRSIVQTVIGQEQALFPESLYKLYIINTGWAFRMGWKILSNFVDPLTYKKVNVLGGSYLKELLKEIPKSQIPKKYGGSGTMEIALGCDAETAAKAIAAGVSPFTTPGGSKKDTSADTAATDATEEKTASADA